MTSVFSNIVYKDNKKLLYDCSISEKDIVCFSYGFPNNTENIPVIEEIISSINIDFPTLRNIFSVESDNISYEIQGKYSKYFIDQNKEYIIIKDNKNVSIQISMKFFTESYKILKNIWEDENEEN